MIIKNNYVIALLVFIGLIVAFNIASSYDNSVGNQVTGMAYYGSFGRITDLLNTVSQFIFHDILERTVIGSFIVYSDVMIRLVIFIILYLIISGIPIWIRSAESQRGLVKHEKYAKVISALIALITAVFIPQEVIYTIFGTPLTPGLFGGVLGLIFWGIAIFLPIYLLFLGLKHTEDRFSKFLVGFLFFGWLLVIGAVETRIAVLTYFTDLWDILIAFGSLSCIVGFFWGIWKGFTGRVSGSQENASSPATNAVRSLEDIGESIGKAFGWRPHEEARRGYRRGRSSGTARGNINSIADRYAKSIKAIKVKVADPREQGRRINALYVSYHREAQNIGVSVRDADYALSRRVRI